MKLLVVDDESYVLRWLEKLFNDTGLYDVFTASNGRGAIELLSVEKMDIVVTDVCMQGISGLDLIEHINSLYPECHVVVLSGYANFDYVYRANRNNVRYLLKTEDDDVILETVLHEKNLIEKERNLIKNAPIGNSRKNDDTESKSVKQIIHTIQKYIATHLNEDLSMSTLATHFSYNSSYIARLYKQETNESLVDYIRYCRTEKARQLLEKTELNVKAIAEQCGFETPQYFAKVFHEATGLSPLEYRKRSRL